MSGWSVLLDGARFDTGNSHRMMTKPCGGRIPLAGTRLNPDGSYTVSDGTLAR